MPLGSFTTSTRAPARTGFGQVPGPIATPPNIFAQLSGALPNFSTLTGNTSNLISNQQSGQISPQTMNALKTGAAQFGVASGMPGSGLEQNQLFGNIAGFSENQQNRGIQNYLSFLSGLSPTMTNPNLAAEITARNADYAAAPDPQKAAEEQFKLWLRGAGASKALSTPASNLPWWAQGQGGGFGTVVRTPGVAGGGAGTPDALGFPAYNMTPESQGVLTARATPPPGGWESPTAWNSGWATGVPDISRFYAGSSGLEDLFGANPEEFLAGGG